MLKLEGGTHFLVVLEHDSGDLHARSFRTFSDALASSASHRNFRISPIFPIDKAPPPAFNAEECSSLIFLGPIYPGDLDLVSAPDLFLSLGTFNVVAWCRNQEEIDELRNVSSERGIAIEVWPLIRTLINREEIEYKSNSVAETFVDFDTRLVVPPELSISAREYSLLMNRAITDAGKFWPTQHKHLEEFNRGFREIVDGEAEDLGKLTDLVVTNAALSRFTSQTYSGTSPILNRESSYATNSLLGIGTASEVLLTLQNFASQAFSSVRLLTRIRCLEKVQLPSKNFYKIQASDDLFKEDFLFSPEIEAELEKRAVEPTVPNITCFSGRDGFRATRHSLSAPLEVISGANTFEWTLMTVTHEMSHLIVEGMLGVFIPNPDDLGASSEFAQALKGDYVPTNLFEEARQLLLYGFGMLDCERGNGIPENPEQVSKCIRHCSAEANEVITHIFDFLYFYQANEELYVNSVWSSWAVVPNIETRYSQYILRTLCALFADRMTFRVSVTLDRFEELMEKLIAGNDKKATADIAQTALDKFVKNRDKYERRLIERIPFAKFVNAFMYSPRIANRLTGNVGAEPPTMGFRRAPIANPLAFMESHAKEHKPAMLKSVWMIQLLAFARGT